MTFLNLSRSSLLAAVLSVACGGGDGKTTDATASSTGTGAQTSGTGPTGTTAPTTGASDGTTSDGTGTGGATGSTGVDVGGFERFRLANAAGPCMPGGDCDGFVELLSTGMLHVEKFGEVGNPLYEAEVDPADFAAAVAVFTDPALLAVLDGPDPLCNPPTDIFESMLVEIDGASHEATTTTCDQPPLVAARMMAASLRDKYAP